MTEKNNDHTCDVDMDNTEITFDNFTILKEFSNIANIVRNEDFFETVPKEKRKRVKWVPMLDCLKRNILNEMVQELSTMWEEENMPEKLAILEKQKEKFGETNVDGTLWRPQLGDVKSQLKAHDAANLKKQKKLLESQAEDYERRVNRLKKTISAKRGYLKAFQMDIQKYQKKNDELITNINDRIENHNSLTKTIVPYRTDVDDIKWSDKDLEFDEEIDKK